MFSALLVIKDYLSHIREDWEMDNRNIQNIYIIKGAFDKRKLNKAVNWMQKLYEWFQQNQVSNKYLSEDHQNILKLGHGLEEAS